MFVVYEYDFELVWFLMDKLYCFLLIEIVVWLIML